MLFIYGGLTLGGIETFFVRMARERKKKGLYTAILLLSKKDASDPELLKEMMLYSDVFFYENFFINKLFIFRKFPLFSKFNLPLVKGLIDKVDQIHVFDGMHAMIGNRINEEFNLKIPITVGFYHYIKYAWGEGCRLPYFERANRKFVFEYLPEQSLLFFSEGIRGFYRKIKKKDFINSNTFRMGVIDIKDNLIFGGLNKTIKIVAVGRLVEFKTYNLFMIDVVYNLKKQGYQVVFDIYGTGPLQGQLLNRVLDMKLSNEIKLRGSLNYSKFDETVRDYDLFIGSGTAIIQAAALGVPSIVGIENMLKSKTYGYLCDVCQYEFNLKGLDLPLVNVEELIIDYIGMSDNERSDLKRKHISSMEEFTNEKCQNSMNELNLVQMPDKPFKYSLWFYELSRVINSLNFRFNKNHPRRTQFKVLQNN